MAGFDLPWGTWDDLFSRQDAINNKPANDVAGHFQAFSGLFHGQPLPIFLGGPKSMNALNPANGADTVRSPGFVLTRSNAHPVQRCGDIIVGITGRHLLHNRKRLVGRLASVFARLGLADT